MQAFLAASNPLENTTWYPDSGATHHMTSDLANLNMKAEEYVGSDHIRVGNGNTIPITHTLVMLIFPHPPSLSHYTMFYVFLISRKISYQFINSPKPLVLSLNSTLFISS